MNERSIDDTIAAIATSAGEGGIGIVRIGGPRALVIADTIFRPASGVKPSSAVSHTLHYGHIIGKAPRFAPLASLGAVQGESQARTKGFGGRGLKSGIIDEVILTVMRGPRSYTREDVVEINCHGGNRAVQGVLERVLQAGARLAEPGEFTKRAFLNGRIDLAQAEAVLDVIRAKTDGSLRVALSQLDGQVSDSVRKLRDEAVAIAAEVEAAIDFPDEDIGLTDIKALAKRAGRAASEIARLARSFSEGAVMREGVLAIICGKPNVGKSSLMNLLLKRDRVIVSPVPGTTRDTVEEMISVMGVPLRLVDTAGITRTRDPIEREGVARSKRYIGQADIVIFMCDASVPLARADREILALIHGIKKVIVVNKCDRKRRVSSAQIRALAKRSPVIEISIKTKYNISRLEKVLAETVLQGRYVQGESVIVSNARHKELLDKALNNMLSVKTALAKNGALETIAIDVKEAISALGSVIGESVSDDILDRIFEQFCIGK